jgi:hypothetical protein
MQIRSMPDFIPATFSIHPNKVFDEVKSRYPTAEVVASDGFDDFLAEVLPVKHTLPLVTAEIGDTWMMGANADPLKVALFRAAQRAHAECVRKGGVNACLVGAETGAHADPSPASVEKFRTFERLIMTAGEHTWGWNGGDIRRKSWSNTELQHSLATDKQFSTAVLTWREQRSMVRAAVAALPATSAIAKQIAGEWALIQQQEEQQQEQEKEEEEQQQQEQQEEEEQQQTQQYRDVALDATVQCGGFTLGFGADGSITTLTTAVTSNSSGGGGSSGSSGSSVEDGAQYAWADAEHPLARVWYHGLDHDYIQRYVLDYVAGPSDIIPDIAGENLAKPNMKLPSISSNVTLTRLRVRKSATAGGANARAAGDGVVLEMSISNKAAHQERGAPATFTANLTCSSSGDTSHPVHTLDLDLRWHNKTASHVPETIWLSNVPLLSATASSSVVGVDKMGSYVDPLDADLQCDGHRLTCGVHLHGVGDGGVRVTESSSSSGGSRGGVSSPRQLQMVSMDTGLVSIGGADPVPTPLLRPNVTDGVHFAIVGNIWNT